MSNLIDSLLDSSYTDSAEKASYIFRLMVIARVVMANEKNESWKTNMKLIIIMQSK